MCRFESGLRLLVPGEHKGTTEIWDGGDVLGIVGERASFERLKVADNLKMGDGHFHELVRKRVKVW